MAEKKKKTSLTDSGGEGIKTSLKKIKVAKPKDVKKITPKKGTTSVKSEVKKAEKPVATKAKTGKSADFAVIRTGGKQYIVRTGEKLKVERLDMEEGSNLKFDDILLVNKGGKIEIGTPKVSGAVVEAKVVSQTKGEKIIVFKYKKRKNYRKKTGHRQKLTEVEIGKI